MTRSRALAELDGLEPRVPVRQQRVRAIWSNYLPDETSHVVD